MKDLTQTFLKILTDMDSGKLLIHARRTGGTGSYFIKDPEAMHGKKFTPVSAVVAKRMVTDGLVETAADDGWTVYQVTEAGKEFIKSKMQTEEQ